MSFRRRYLYILLFAVPALLVSIIAAGAMLAAAAGALWLFVYGDNPWPSGSSVLLVSVLVVGGAGLWLALLSVAYSVGKRQESCESLNIRHVALSVGATIVLVVLIVGRFMSLKRSPTDSLVCADFCRAEGFAASGTSPRNSDVRFCFCYDAQGREARKVPLAEVEGRRK